MARPRDRKKGLKDVIKSRRRKVRKQEAGNGGTTLPRTATAPDESPVRPPRKRTSAYPSADSTQSREKGRKGTETRKISLTFFLTINIYEIEMKKLRKGLFQPSETEKWPGCDTEKTMRRCEKAHFTIQNAPFRVMICTISAHKMHHIAVRNGAFRNAIRFLLLHVMRAIAHNTQISSALKLHAHIRDICTQE